VVSIVHIFKRQNDNIIEPQILQIKLVWKHFTVLINFLLMNQRWWSRRTEACRSLIVHEFIALLEGGVTDYFLIVGSTTGWHPSNFCTLHVDGTKEALCTKLRYLWSELTRYPVCFTALVTRLRTQIGNTFSDFDWNKGNTTSTKKVLFSIMSLHLRLG